MKLPPRLALGAAMLLGLSLAAARDLEAQRRCVRGIPCGNTCIAANRTCRTGSPPSQPTPAPTSRATPTAPPASPAPAPAPSAAPQPAYATPAAPAGGLTVPGVPGYVALDTIELLEVQGARLRALERRGLAGAGVSVPAPTADPQSYSVPQPPATPASSGPWVASRRGSTYYRSGCSGANGLAAQNRIYFQTEAEAQAAGYRRSSARGC